MREPVNGDTVLKLLKELGRNCRGPGTVYITGGTSAVVIGWRETTIDVDLKFQPEPLGVFEKIPQLKNELNVNIELASPDDFIPALPGWQERSQWSIPKICSNFINNLPLSNWHATLQSNLQQLKQP